jgi:hypothetical protein
VSQNFTAATANCSVLAFSCSDFSDMLNARAFLVPGSSPRKLRENALSIQPRGKFFIQGRFWCGKFFTLQRGNHSHVRVISISKSQQSKNLRIV